MTWRCKVTEKLKTHISPPVKHTSRSSLAYLSRSTKVPFRKCKRCQRVFHVACLEQEGVTLVNELCSLCQLGATEVLFRLERCRQEEKRLLYASRKLRSVMEFLRACAGTEVSEEQQDLFLDNLDAFQALVQQFVASTQAIRTIKMEVLQDVDMSVTHPMHPPV